MDSLRIQMSTKPEKEYPLATERVFRPLQDLCLPY